jgi:hypothetical protein
MPDPSTLYGHATPEMAFHPSQEWPACRAGYLWPSSTPLDTLCRMSMAEAVGDDAPKSAAAATFLPPQAMIAEAMVNDVVGQGGRREGSNKKD